jgi:hypothetical protein
VNGSYIVSYIGDDDDDDEKAKIISVIIEAGGWDSSISIVTGYGLDSPGIESRWGEIFRTCPDQPWGPPSLLYNG